MRTQRTGLVAALGAAMLLAVAPLGGQAAQQDTTVGALRPGDRIFLRVDGEKQWTDTFTVKPGPGIELPAIGSIPLAGVRRGDLESYLTHEIGRYLKNPVVRANALVRLIVLGEVARPGFYEMSADTPLADAITDAGGPTRDANLAKLHIDRAGTTVHKGNPLRVAISRGATLSQLDLRQGDEIVVPRAADSERTARIVSLVVGVPLAILGILILRPKL